MCKRCFHLQELIGLDRKPHLHPYYFRSYDPGTMGLLSRTPIQPHNLSAGMKDLGFLSEMFPALVTRKAAVSRELLTLLSSTMGGGNMSYLQVSRSLSMCYRHRHSRLYNIYMSYEIANKGASYINGRTLQRAVRAWPPKPFSSFRGRGYSGKAPSPNYLLAVSLAYHRLRKPVLTSRLMMVTGRILKGDMSHKVPKKIRADRFGQFTSLFTLMNENGEIAGFWFCRTKSVEQLETDFKKVQERYYRAAGTSNTCRFTCLRFPCLALDNSYLPANALCRPERPGGRSGVVLHGLVLRGVPIADGMLPDSSPSHGCIPG